MPADLARLRDLHGRTAAVWGGDATRVLPGRWVALSGARAVDFNVALVHGASGGAAIAETLEEVAATRAPAIVMVAGPALAEVQPLVRAGWACVGGGAFMDLELPGPAEPIVGVRRLTHAEVPAAQAIVAEVFGFDLELAATAVPETTVEEPGCALWGRFGPEGALVCVAATMVVEDVVGAWSVATAPDHRRRGHAAALLRAALGAAWEDGARRCLLSSSAEGEPLYRRLGFSELERWQHWSRPRWVISPY